MYTFPLTDNERIIKKGHASLHCESDAWTGALYLTTERLVFVGYMMDISRKYMENIQLEHISEVLGEKTFFVFPNVLVIATIQGVKINFIVSDRNNWLSAIKEELNLA